MPLKSFEKLERLVEANDGIEIFSKEANRSLYNLLPGYFREAIDKTPKEYFLLTEKQLIREFGPPDIELAQLRMAFWAEYNRAQSVESNMNMANVYAMIYTQHHFTGFVIHKPENVAFILKPPAAWRSGIEAILNQSIRIMYDAVTSFDATSDFDPKKLTAIMKIIDKAIIYTQGLPTIRTENKTVSVNVNQSMPGPDFSSKSVNDMRAELEKLKANLLPPAQPSIVDAMSVHVDDKVGVDRE